MNTYTPTGSQTFTNQGTDPTTGAPIYTQQVTLSPEQQALYNSNTANQINSSGFAGSALQTARDSYQPINTDYQGNLQKTQDALYKSQSQYLDPQYEQQQKGLDAKLAAEGITPGSEAYNTAYQQFNAGKQQAYSNAQMNAITGATGQEGQQIQQGIALQNQPLNYYNALMSGSQASPPSFNTPQSQQTNPADVSGAIQNAYQGNLQNANASNAAANQTTSEVGSLLAMYLMSDRRMKRDIECIGKLDSGLAVYKFKYLDSNITHIGVMAQEAKELFPDAVIEHEGCLMVNYGGIH